MTVGVRYPTLAFITSGGGQSNEGIPPQAYETFCYDSALLEAKIENFNIVPYTSVLPKDLSIVKSDDIKQEASDMTMQFEIKYAGLEDGLMHFLYVDYSNGRTETKLTFSKEQKFIDIEGMHIQILDASADEVQYILRN